MTVVGPHLGHRVRNVRDDSIGVPIIRLDPEERETVDVRYPISGQSRQNDLRQLLHA